MEAIENPLGVVRSAVGPIAGLSVLDIGCGGGSLARLMAAEGASVTGIDPESAALERARAQAPDVRFIEASAERLPFGDGEFDLAVMVGALHHIPEPLMALSLEEAARVLKPEARLIVIEPLAQGNFFEALRLIEDETEVRSRAQAALAAAVRAGALVVRRTLSYVRRETFGDIDSFFARIIAVDPARRRLIEDNRGVIAKSASALAIRGGDGQMIFDQPFKADILETAGTGSS